MNCLKEMLMATLFEPVEDSVSITDFGVPLFDKKKEIRKGAHKGVEERKYKIGRLCIIAKAVSPKNADSEFLRELKRTFRNPGLDLSHV